MRKYDYDIVHHPSVGIGRACVVIQSPSDRYDGYVLAPMTDSGWPTTSQSRWIYLRGDASLKLWSKADAHLRFCPVCSQNQGEDWRSNPLAKLSVYVEEWKCKSCRRIFTPADLGIQFVYVVKEDNWPKGEKIVAIFGRREDAEEFINTKESHYNFEAWEVK